MYLVIDNYDSFVYNLIQYLGNLNKDIKVFRNDKISIEEINKLSPSHIFISPGPSIAENAGISVDLVKKFAGKVPIFGICLGHQAIAYAFGANIVRSSKLFHGKTSYIYHDNKTIYKGLKNPFIATRYHSLIVEKDTLPQCFQITAKTKDNIIMGIRHKEFKIEGVQFHPESILTEGGMKLLTNFVGKGL